MDQWLLTLPAAPTVQAPVSPRLAAILASFDVAEPMEVRSLVEAVSMADGALGEHTESIRELAVEQLVAASHQQPSSRNA